MAPRARWNPHRCPSSAKAATTSPSASSSCCWTGRCSWPSPRSACRPRRPTLPSRSSAAAVGFWLNGRYTFADGDGSRLGWRRFARFWVLWLAMTALSTLLLASVEARLGLHWALLAKPVVEGGLAVANFFLMRRLVFR